MLDAFSIMYFSVVILFILLSVATIKNTADAISVKIENWTVDERRAFVLKGFYKPMGSKEERSYIFYYRFIAIFRTIVLVST